MVNVCKFNSAISAICKNFYVAFLSLFVFGFFHIFTEYWHISNFISTLTSPLHFASFSIQFDSILLYCFIRFVFNSNALRLNLLGKCVMMENRWKKGGKFISVVLFIYCYHRQHNFPYLLTAFRVLWLYFSVMETNRLNINKHLIFFAQRRRCFGISVVYRNYLISRWMIQRISTATTRRPTVLSLPPETCIKVSTFQSVLNALVSFFTKLTYLAIHHHYFSDSFHGYGIQREQKSCLYKTTSSDYGYFTPSPHSVPTRYETCNTQVTIFPLVLFTRFKVLPVESTVQLTFGFHRNVPKLLLEYQFRQTLL